MSEQNTISEAQLAANRANAEHSTGPRTAAGKAKVSVNAVKTGLTGRTVFLPTEDAQKYESLLKDFFEALDPVGILEAALVQSIADCRWRLERIPGLEANLLTNGLVEISQQNPDMECTNIGFLEMNIRTKYAKEFRNLEIQEARLSRRHDKDMEKLEKLQAARKAQEEEELEEAAEARLVAEHRNEPFDLEENGFEFSKEGFEKYFAKLSPARKKQLLERGLNSAPTARKAAA